MRTLAALTACILLIGASAQADEPTDVDAAIDRGLAFLAKDAVAWKEKHNCVSCHHAALIVWSMREAKQQGWTVDEPLLAELTKWIAESGDGKTTAPRPESAPRALNSKPIWFALGLEADAEPDGATLDGLKTLLATVKEDQTDDGSWTTWPETRPPIFGGNDDSNTTLALLSLLPAAARGDESVIAARDKGVAWLAARPVDDDAQSVALRLILWQRLERPAEEWRPLVERIKARQNDDGGWSQTADMVSDAWATGQALYALAHAGIKSDDPAVARARAFLATTQNEDGSWTMTSRPSKTGDTGAKNLVPITGAGSAWAVLGLVRSR